MPLDVENLSLGVYLTAPHGDVELGTFTVTAGAIAGTDQLRGISYSGRCTPTPDGGVDVEVTASVPAGTRVSGAVTTDAVAEHDLTFHLDPEQVAGAKSAPITLPGFGSANVRLEVR
jgi:hypothetical protein